MIQRRFHHSFGRGRTVFFKDMLFKRTAVHTDSYRYLFSFADIRNRFYPGFIAYISGIYSDLIYTSFGSADRKSVVKMNIGNKRNINGVFDRLYKLKILFVRYSETNDLTACRGKFLCLSNRTLDIACRYIKHGLNKYGRIAADICIAESVLSCFSAFDHYKHQILFAACAHHPAADGRACL